LTCRIVRRSAAHEEVVAVATDYDAPRNRPEDEPEADSIEALRGNPTEKQSPKVDVDEDTEGDSFELPGADLSHEELHIVVTPRQDDEFMCSRCFLLHGPSMRVPGTDHCRDCD